MDLYTPYRTMTKRTAKKRIGRPPMDPEKRRDLQIKIPVSTSERAALQALADAEARTLADWARVRLLDLVSK
jgi:hypothetical protein